MATATAPSDGGIPEPTLSTHCRERYAERVPADAVAIETALAEAVPDDGICRHPAFDDVDRVWCFTGRADDEWFTVVFLERAGVAVTCWLAGAYHYPAVGAYLIVRGMEGLVHA